MKKTLTILIASFFLAYSGNCLAGSPKGIDKKEKNINGFSQGEKSGWDGEYPKGWDKLSEKEKKEWALKHGLEKDSEGKSKKNKPKNSKKNNKKKS